LLGYNLYLDYVLVGTTSDLFWQYTNVIPDQTYMAGVSAIYDDGESGIIEYEFSNILYVPRDLTVTAEGYGTWDIPDAGDWLYYDDGINVYDIGGPQTFSWAVKFDPTQLAEYDGTSVTKISLYCNSEATNTLQIFKGSSYSPYTLLYEQDLDGLEVGAWNEIELTRSVTIDTTQSLWITVYTEDGVNYPAACGDNTGQPNGDLIILDGTTWEHLSDHNLMYTWNLRAYVTDQVGKQLQLGKLSNSKVYNSNEETLAVSGIVNDSENAVLIMDTKASRDVLGYNVYLDGTMVGTTSDLFWQYTNLIPDQAYMAGVSSVYDNGESHIVEYGFAGMPSLLFDGYNDYAQVSNYTYPTTDFTIEAWIKPNIVGGRMEIIYGNNNYDDNNIQFRVQEDGTLLYWEGGLSSSNSDYLLTPEPCIILNEWNHVAVVREGEWYCKIYVNGNLLAEGVANRGVHPTNMYIGTRASHEDRFFGGNIVDVRIWDVAHTQSEIQENMNKFLDGTENGLIS
jgi:hypothetical protein